MKEITVDRALATDAIAEIINYKTSLEKLIVKNMKYSVDSEDQETKAFYSQCVLNFEKALAMLKQGPAIGYILSKYSGEGSNYERYYCYSRNRRR